MQYPEETITISTEEYEGLLYVVRQMDYCYDVIPSFNKILADFAEQYKERQ